MKHQLIFIFLLFLATRLVSQTQQVINYQGAARDAYGVPMPNKALGIKFELLQGNNLLSVYSETQSVTTNSIGLFTTQIGIKNPNGLAAVNFSQGGITLRTSIDTTGGSNYIELGTQKMTSVPYAMHAQSVPVTYTGNVLTIGTRSFELNQSTQGIFTASTGISILSNSILVNTLPDQTVTIKPGNSNVQVNGVYPDFTVTAAPTLSMLSVGSLSVSNGNSVSITQPVTFSNSVLRVGPSSNTVVIPSSITTMTGTGAANVQTLSTNSFSIHVPFTQITPGQNVQVSGFSPNYTLATNPQLSILPPNTLSVSGGNSVALPVTAVTANGLASVTQAGNTYNVNVPLLNYLPGTGFLSSGSNGVNITPQFTLNNTVLTVGPTSNSVNLSVLTPWRQSGTNVSLANSGDNVGIGTAAPTQKLDVVGNLRFSGALMPAGNSGIAGQIFQSNGVAAPIWVTPIYNSLTGIFSLGTASANLTPSVILSNTLLTVGPTTNTVNLSPIMPWRQGLGTVTLATSSDRVGIGTNSPLHYLDVHSNGFTSSRIISHINSTNSGGQLILGFSRGTEAAPAAVLSGDNIGELAFQGFAATSYSNTAWIRARAAENWTSTASRATRLDFVTHGNGGVGNQTRMALTPEGLAIGTAYASTATPPLDGLIVQGNMGVGTNTPNANNTNGRVLSIQSTTSFVTSAAALELTGASGITNVPVSKIDFNSLWTSNSPTNTARIALMQPGNVFKGELAFSTNDGSTLQERMRISENGNVSIGTLNTWGKLHVQRDDAGWVAYVGNGSLGGGTGLYAEVNTYSATSAGNRYGVEARAWYGQNDNYGIYAYGWGGTTSYGIYAQSGGATNNWGGYFVGRGLFTNEVSIGHSTAPAYGLDVKHNGGTYMAEFENTNTGTGADGIKVSVNALTPVSSAYWFGCYANAGNSLHGGVTANGLGQVAFVTTSDRRLKQNIKDWTNTLDIIEKIQPKQYEFIERPTITSYGFIAQELKEILPMAVTGDPNSDVEKEPMMVDYSKLTPLLTGGIKELHAIAKKQQLEINELKIKLEQQQVIIDQLIKK